MQVRQAHAYRYYRCSQLRIVPGHARDWRFAEEELDRQVLAMFKGMRVDDDEVRQWFVDVLKSRASFVHAQEREELDVIRKQQTKLEDNRRHLETLLIDRVLDRDRYAARDQEIRDEQAGLKLTLESLSRSAEEDVAVAVRCFELSQALAERWLTADLRAKRQILNIVGLNYRMDGVTLVVEKRKPFDLLAEGHISHHGGGIENRRETAQLQREYPHSTHVAQIDGQLKNIRVHTDIL